MSGYEDGPWTIKEGDGKYYVLGGDYAYLTTGNTPSSRPRVIASVERLEDARLITAAPDLYEKLLGLVGAIDDWDRALADGRPEILEEYGPKKRKALGEAIKSLSLAMQG